MKRITLLLLVFNILFCYETKAQTNEPSNKADVSNFTQFENALKNSNVTTINIIESFNFTNNIVNVPNRDITILGNKNLDIVINSNKYSIYGKQNYKGRNTFSIVNANIIGDNIVGRFFTGGAGNGPSSHGWDVYAKDINYKGARFVHLSEGTLTFDGNNTVNTSCENAWVHSLVFMKGSMYKGSAATIGQFSAFYFNGDLIKGKAIGTVSIEGGAIVDLTISPDNDKNYYYPAFYDKVYKVDVEEFASLKVNAAGVAFQFIPRADYLETPSFNIKENAIVELIGRGGGNYSTMKLQYYKTSVNIKPAGSLVIKGNSTKSVIESIYKGAEINVTKSNLTIQNKTKGAPLFYSKETALNIEEVDEIYTWNKTGGEYQSPANKIFSNFTKLNTIIQKNSNGVITTDNPSALDGFQVGNYGKISMVSSSIMRSAKSIDNFNNNLVDINTLQYTSQNGTLTITSDNEISSLEIYNLQGKLISKEQTNSTNISTVVTPGVYIIKALVNKQIITKKILVK